MGRAGEVCEAVRETRCTLPSHKENVSTGRSEPHTCRTINFVKCPQVPWYCCKMFWQLAMFCQTLFELSCWPKLQCSETFSFPLPKNAFLSPPYSFCKTFSTVICKIINDLNIKWSQNCFLSLSLCPWWQDPARMTHTKAKAEGDDTWRHTLRFMIY